MILFWHCTLDAITCWCPRFQTLRLDGLLYRSGRGRKTSLPAEAVCRDLRQAKHSRIGESRWCWVAEIPTTCANRLWATNDLKPNLTRAFRLSNDLHVEDKFWTSLDYIFYSPDKALVLSCDEKSLTKDQERMQSGLYLRIGHIRRKLHD